jgi:hypothetical protein
MAATPGDYRLRHRCRGVEHNLKLIRIRRIHVDGCHRTVQIIHDDIELIVGRAGAAIQHGLYGIVPGIKAHGGIHDELQRMTFGADQLEGLRLACQRRGRHRELVTLGRGRQHRQQEHAGAQGNPETPTHAHRDDAVQTNARWATYSLLPLAAVACTPVKVTGALPAMGVTCGPTPSCSAV